MPEIRFSAMGKQPVHLKDETDLQLLLLMPPTPMLQLFHCNPFLQPGVHRRATFLAQAAGKTHHQNHPIQGHESVTRQPHS
jgi:hypothetical protein